MESWCRASWSCATIFERCGGFHERFITSCEDLYFLLNAREYGHFRCVPEPLLRKETRPLYPKALEREPECELFVELVRERYGASADGLIDGFRRSRVKVLRHLGRVLIDEGRPIDARRCLARVLHYEPASPKAYYRYLKTFIAPRAARASSSTDEVQRRLIDRWRLRSIPRVSVIIPVYNGAATIDRALKSVFDQTFTDYEIVICDDGSTDDTPSVLAKYGDKLRVVRQSNRGLPAARNAAVGG